MGYADDRELILYRNLVEPPSAYAEGFGWKTVIGALLLGFLITPGSLYIYLVAGEGVGPAARWVTIFLFAEVAKRSLKELRQQEVFILYYMSGVVLASNSGFLWNIYCMQSEAFQSMGIAKVLPAWVVPQPELWTERTLFARPWLLPILLFATTVIISRIDHFGLGYFLYRLVSDGERLPFPMATVGASGIIAMAETKEKHLRWRPACFAIGGVLGLVFGFVYLGVPAITGLLLREPMFILPIPWIELTPAVKDILPATPVNIVPNLALVIAGMVLPFWAIIGGALGVLITVIINPLLYRHGILTHWRPGMQTVDTIFNNQIDFYLSFGLGITFFIALLGLYQAFKPLLAAAWKGRTETADDGLSLWERTQRGKPGRGDISVWISLGIYIFSTVSYLTISYFLVDGFPWVFFLLYGFIYTPLISYATAKVEGLVGQSIAIPYVREAGFILSGYRGVAIWYAPIPLHNYGAATVDFRVIELTGTRLWSVIKTDLVAVPILIVSLVFFSSVIWGQADLRSEQYPFVQRVWDLNARNQALVISSTMEGRRSLFFEALRGDYVLYGLGLGGLLYGALSFFGLPVLMVFGVVRSLGSANPLGIVPELIGALLGRFYFRRKYGEMWQKYAPAVFAGFTCGVGLIGMMGVALRLIATAVSPQAY